jgi:hypothetical protein
MMNPDTIKELMFYPGMTGVEPQGGKLQIKKKI